MAQRQPAHGFGGSEGMREELDLDPQSQKVVVMSQDCSKKRSATGDQGEEPVVGFQGHTPLPLKIGDPKLAVSARLSKAGPAEVA